MHEPSMSVLRLAILIYEVLEGVLFQGGLYSRPSTAFCLPELSLNA